MTRRTDADWMAIGEPGATVTMSATLANRLRCWTLDALTAEWRAYDEDTRTGETSPRFVAMQNRRRAEKLAALLRDLDAVSAVLKPHGLGDGKDAIESWARSFVGAWLLAVGA